MSSKIAEFSLFNLKILTGTDLIDIKVAATFEDWKRPNSEGNVEKIASATGRLHYINIKQSPRTTTLVGYVEVGYFNMLEIYLNKKARFETPDGRGYWVFLSHIEELEDNPFYPDYIKFSLEMILES